MKGLIRHTLHLAAITACIVSEATAQEGSDRVGRRWEVSATLGWAAAERASQSLEESMIVAGFDETSPAYCFVFCVEAQSHPRTIGTRSSTITITLSYTARSWLQLRGIYAPGGAMKSTIGHRADGSTSGSSLALTPSVSAVAFVPVLTLDGVLRAGVGPSLNVIELAGGEDSHRRTRVGVLVDAGLTFPPRSRFFVEITAQYRYVPPVEMGPFRAPASEIFAGDGSILPQARVDLRYAALSLGGGIRF